MAVSGVRAQRFLQPAPGGASAVFARQRGMVAPAPAPARLAAAEEKESRSGKASGRDYGNFFSRKRNVSAIQGAVNALKGLLVGTFIAAKSLGATLKGVVKQIKGMSGGGGGGLFGTLGMIGLVGAIIAGVAAIFGPQIKKAFNFLKGKAEETFQNVKERLSDVNDKLKNFYTGIQTYVNDTLIGMIDKINAVIVALKPIADKLYHLPKKLGPFDISHITGPIKDLGKAVYGLPQIPSPPKLPSYDKLLGDNGINFLKSYDSLGDLGGAMVSGAGSMLGGGIDSMTGFVGDIVNNLLASLGLTDAGNLASEYLGLGKQFGESRELGSGEGISSLIPGGFEGIIPGIKSTLGLGGDSGSNTGTSTGVGTVEQRAMLDAVSFAEGTTASYGTIYGGAVVPELERGELTIDEVLKMQSTGMLRGRNVGYKKDGNNSDATGKYQFMSYVLKEEAQKQGISGDTLFTPELQDQMILGRISGYRGVTPELLAKEGMSANVIDKLSPEFASFSNLVGAGDEGRAPGEGRSYYSGQNVKSSQSIIDAYNKSLQSNTPPPPPPKPTTQPAPAQTQSSNTTVPKPVKKASTIVLPAGPQVAQAPRRPRPDTSVPNISGEGGNPTIAFLPTGYIDRFDFNPIGAGG